MRQMNFSFAMTMLDDDGEPVRTVETRVILPEDTTHDTITQIFQDFLSGCGYVFRGYLCYVRDNEVVVEDRPNLIEDEEAPL